MMKREKALSAADKITVGSLIVAAVGVVIQIIAGYPYPAIPPVFFILLIPAGLIAFGRWRWAPIFAILAGLFLTIGLFASGGMDRLFRSNNLSDAVGLWIQMLAVVVATIAAIITVIQNYRSRTAGLQDSPR